MKIIRLYRWLILHPLILVSLLLPLSAYSAKGGTAVAIEGTRKNTLTGFTRARAKMKVISQVSDRIIEVKNDVGDTIGPDGIFANIDSTMARLDLESNRINQKKLLSKTSYLQKEVTRFATLLKQQSTAEAKFDSLEQELVQAQLALQTLENDEKKIKELIERHRVTAKPGWKVISRRVEPGEWVTAGSVLAEIGDYRTIIVPFALEQHEYSWLQKNSGALKLWIPEQEIHVKAHILRVSPGFDQQTRKLNLEMEISGLSNMRGGIRTELNMELPDPSGAVMIPESALSSRYDSFWLTSPDNQRIPVVKLGPGQIDGTIRVSSPAVKPGDRFLLDNQPENKDVQ